MIHPPIALRFPHPLRLLCLVSMALLCSAASPALAQSAGDPPPVHRPEMPRQNPANSLSDAVRRAQRETGGQVLGAGRIQFDGRDINRVKVMDDRGRVRYMDEDPQRGRDHPLDRQRDPERGPSGPPRPRGDNPPRR